MTRPDNARYTNPIATAGDFADPFVLRFNGRYYLYCTNEDLRCWSSADLVVWDPHGPTISPDLMPGLVPFAPEVVYANGLFYLYTSPSGTGHVVLRSDSPTGPFEAVSDNVAHDIDGNVLIDDDGRWYFYWAGDEGIWACEMTSPTTFGEPVLTGATMHGWTEGPFVTKVDGRYHMTLTGNHYLAPGYRINAAVSDHPLRGYVDDPLNPLLLNVEGAGIGLGHSSSVVGPDLVSTYMAYHNLNPDESRDLNLARQVRNGDSIQVLGPVDSAPTPRAPDARCDWRQPDAIEQWDVRVGGFAVDGDWAETVTSTEALWRHPALLDAFTAEITLAGTTLARYGILIESAETVRLVVDPELNTIALGDARERLPADFAHGAAHTYTLVRTSSTLTVFVDGRQQLEGVVEAGPVRIGVASDAAGARVGYAAATASDRAAADRAAVKPVPGRFWAAMREGDATLAPTRVAGVDFNILDLSTPEDARFVLDVPVAGAYRIHLTGEFSAGDAVEVSLAEKGHSRALTATGATRMLATDVLLPSGSVPLRMRGIAGRPRIALVTLLVATAAPPAYELSEAVHLEGFGKLIIDDRKWEDFELEASLRWRPRAVEAHADVLFRTAQPSEGGSTADDTELGMDFFLGYSVQLSASGVTLARHDYDTKVLAEHRRDLDPTAPVKVLIRMSGGAIVVALDGVELLHYDDPLPHLSGGFGGRVAAATLSFDRVGAAPLPTEADRGVGARLMG